MSGGIPPDQPLGLFSLDTHLALDQQRQYSQVLFIKKRIPCVTYRLWFDFQGTSFHPQHNWHYYPAQVCDVHFNVDFIVVPELWPRAWLVLNEGDWRTRHCVISLWEGRLRLVIS